MSRLAEVNLFTDQPEFGSSHTREQLIRTTAKDPELDWQLVVLLRRKASELITQAAAEINPLAEADRRLLGRSIVRRVVRDHVEALSSTGKALWPVEAEYACAQAVESAIFGYGRLQPLFEIPEAENIEIHGCDSVVVQFGDGHRETRPPVADSDEELVEAIRFLGESVSPARPFDDTHPMLTLALGDRFRLHAIGFGLSFRPSVTIRQHTLTDITLEELAEGGLMPLEVADFLRAAVLARKSMVISGDQGAGKTTLLRALIAAIPDNERFGTLETDYELLTHLQPNRKNMLALQSRVGMGEVVSGRRLGEYTVADLIPEALRQNLSRLVVGEVRGSEAGAMFEAMTAGAGTLSTTHSHSSASTIDRLASRVAQGGVLTVDEAYRQIAHHLHLLIHVRLVDDTWRGGVRRRSIAEIRQLTGGMEAGRPVTHLAFHGDSPSQYAFYPDAELSAELATYLTGARQ
ncbi:CpaF family protein [Propionicimonas sp.]|uniref:CpaF family protein n=2 Tax=Propionicimonas sp. TaxID=1955623 RepID=UPI0018423287|nr:CpaF/VirB11 family protein [Propionicimonas sp.]MBU3976285.1 CpaF/VirB11 family protein [Actinomycetota bacterium]MBA3022121.1 CpaF family protein [Propionicimonas sp.]MBU3987442.1 CpaF/VirB11 family protein [Actinomycetota bacterium]MBU4006613.1 CpaF/VirB11 family protein [Actinomycetota bacterium]MBU4065218.1 CpaF/VirB11 family protein [Actinomycetota bacterium]